MTGIFDKRLLPVGICHAVGTDTVFSLLWNMRLHNHVQKNGQLQTVCKITQFTLFLRLGVNSCLLTVVSLTANDCA